MRMRWFAAFAILTAAPALAEPSRCSVQGPMETAQIDAPSLQAAPAAAAAMSVASPTTGPAAHPISPNLAGMAFLQHVAAAGATLIDLGVAHGLHLAAARSGDEFRMFAVLPSGQAAIEGAPVELGVAQLAAIASGNITPLGEKAGFTGYFVRSGQQFQVFYAAPDNSVVCRVSCGTPRAGISPATRWRPSPAPSRRSRSPGIPAGPPRRPPRRRQRTLPARQPQSRPWKSRTTERSGRHRRRGCSC